MKTCLASGVPIGQTDGNGRNAAHWAADYGLSLKLIDLGQLEVLTFLAQNGLPVDNGDNFGITPLLAAGKTICLS